MKWGGLFVSGLLVVVWVFSMWWSLYRISFLGITNDFGIIHGCVWFEGRSSNASEYAKLFHHDTKWFLGRTPEPFFVGRVSWDSQSRLHFSIPLWALALPATLVTVLIWRHDRLATCRAMTGACPKCTYDRRGIPADAPCPECGTSPTTPAAARLRQCNSMKA